ncbi:TM2 domain-containing protein [Corynebacterium gerontici]|uniref:TM2 domain protein n=1 Tax=Corynebacterium gerontici TaxID=2079234 RepID=A0A3G6J060_9CORY|nr:TM2 domain-containing protein [Corynebacterium gerontici]AZA11337.1 TM2 domain protein [Corynebacterium gerontici]
MTNPYQRPTQAQNPYGTTPYGSNSFNLPQHQGPYLPLNQKNRVIAAVLAFFLGSFGVHNFYLGYNTKGLIQAGLGIFGWLTAIFLIGFLVLAGVSLWALAELILIIANVGPYQTDARGVPLD